MLSHLRIAKPSAARLRAFWHYFWVYGSVLVIATALLVALARHLLPGIGQYRTDIEQIVSAHLEQPISINSIHADWGGWTPQLRLDGVRLLDSAGGRTITYFEQVWIDVRPLASLLQWNLVPGKVTLSGLELSVERTKDGAIVMEGFDADDDSEGSRNALLSWLLEQDDLTIKSTTVTWRDNQRHSRPLTFDNIALRLRNSGSHHLLEGSSGLPKDMGQSIRFALDANGDLLSEHWSGTFFAKGKAIDLQGWPVPKSAAGIRLDSGIIDIQLWSEWKNARPASFQSILDGSSVQLATAQRKLTIDKLSGTISGQRHGGTDWSFKVADLAITTPQGEWPVTNLSLRATHQAEGDAFNIEGHADYLKLDEIGPLLPDITIIPQQIRSLLGELQPRGELENVNFKYYPRANGADEFHVHTRFNNLVIQATRNIPGINGLNGELKSDADSGVINIDSVSVQLNFPALFHNEISIDKLAGDLSWRTDGKDWIFESGAIVAENRDLTATATGKLHFIAGKHAPIANVVVNFSDGDISQIGKYLPRQIMKPRLGNWLEAALSSGKITSGGMLLHGPLDQFPFANDAGKFELRLNIEKGILDYHPAWPRIEEIEAEVLFSGRSLKIRSNGGRMIGGDLLNVEAIIPDLVATTPTLAVSGKVNGTIATGMRFLQQSPLHKAIGRRIEALNLDGDIELALKLDIPLRAGAKPRFNGLLHLNNTAMGENRFGIRLTQVNGNILLNNTGIEARGITALLADRPLQIDISTLKPEAGPASTHIEFTGIADREFLAGQFAPDLMQSPTHRQSTLFDFFAGETSWQATLDIPENWQDTDIDARFILRSDTDGLAVNLPEPLLKKADRKVPLFLESTFNRSGRRELTLAWGDILNGRFLFKVDRDTTVLEKGELRFGTQPARLPEENQLRLAGVVGQFSSSLWQQFLAGGNIGGHADVDKLLPDRAQIDVAVGHFEIMGQWFPDTRLIITRSGNDWVANVDGKKLKGQIKFKAGTDGAPLEIDLKHLHLSHINKSPGNEPLEPFRIPPLKISCEDLSFNDQSLGHLRIQTRPTDTGIHFEILELESSTLTVSADGDWTSVDGKEQSRFNIVAEGMRVSSVLATLGYGDAALKGGKTELKLQVSWPGAPTAFALEKLDGKLAMKITHGRILNVDPGIGRIFGLLSLRSLPRRLALDFSDLFSRGLSFDKIEGNFTIDGGDAYTHDLYIESPTAHIEIAGRTGLIDRDYDQIITITPELENTLPLAGALIGGPAGAGVGVLLMAAKKLFKPLKKGAEKGTLRQYSITGSWENPVIERIKPDQEPDAAETATNEVEDAQ